ncbi:MAG: NAD(P)/FAD-dependent oxidoreductase, partial [Rhodoferax sp.]|uniref:FAD-dependent monooxygenase n=1 Tax=Rhodoferax sp. TaxID=50421 RepID=UPI003BB63150
MSAAFSSRCSGSNGALLKNTKVMIKKVVVVGAGPSGLMAAEVLSGAGVQVLLFDAMPSVG